MTEEILCAALGSGLFATLVGLNAQYLGRLLGLLDFPDPVGGRKRHSHVTPLMGGTAVLIPIVLMLFAMFFGFADAPAAARGELGIIGCLVAVFYVVGASDDRWELSPRFRLVVAVAAFSLGMILVPALDIQSLRFELVGSRPGEVQTIALGSLSGIFTLFCMVGLLNAVNMADGKNGLVIGLSLMWTGFLSLYAPEHVEGVLLVVAAALAVALYFNLRGRFFLGDGGSYGLSALFGALAIYVYNQPESALSAGPVAVWFIIPVLDCLRLLTTRLLKGRSPFSGDRDHLHHHLGYLIGWPNGLLVYWSMVGIPSIASYVLPEFNLQILVAVALVYTMVITIAYRRQTVNAS
ncbi:glycosyltransferase family 4 protein [Pedomonas sp. V897]|uniref:glycosyltransferase family 4 protein n=1 Tax=Pedomonas sp. V897 TaxID=3446482 RepID=UPI003EE3FAB9